MVNVRVDTSGPLFDGRFPRIVDDMVQDMVWEVGMQAFADVHQNADGSFKNPTPYYETQITQEWHGRDVLVHDRGIVYGPWLERGRSTTRFRGYHIWERATRSTQRKAQGLIQPILARYIAKLNGF